MPCQLQPKWTASAQWAVGDQTPSTSVFDVKDAERSTAPQTTETVALNDVQGARSAKVSVNRVGWVFGDEKAGVHPQFVMDPVVLTNLFVNYTVKGPVAGSSSAKPNAGDVLTALPARSITLTATLDF